MCYEVQTSLQNDAVFNFFFFVFLEAVCLLVVCGKRGKMSQLELGFGPTVSHLPEECILSLSTLHCAATVPTPSPANSSTKEISCWRRSDHSYGRRSNPDLRTCCLSMITNVENDEKFHLLGGYSTNWTIRRWDLPLRKVQRKYALCNWRLGLWMKFEDKREAV